MCSPLAGGLTGLGFAGKFFSGRGFVLSCFLLFYGKGKGIEGRVDQCDDSTTPGTEDESETSSVTLYVVVSHYPLDPQLTIYNAQCYAKAIKGRLSSN